MKNFIIDKAVQEAKKSLLQHKIGCVIFRKKNILAFGHNHILRSTKHLQSRFQRWPGSVHAEVATIISARTNLSKSSILVVRVNKTGQFGLSKPCKHCMSYIQFVGIRKIWYSISKYPYFEGKRL